MVCGAAHLLLLTCWCGRPRDPDFDLKWACSHLQKLEERGRVWPAETLLPEVGSTVADGRCEQRDEESPQSAGESHFLRGRKNNCHVHSCSRTLFLGLLLSRRLYRRSGTRFSCNGRGSLCIFLSLPSLNVASLLSDSDGHRHRHGQQKQFPACAARGSRSRGRPECFCYKTTVCCIPRWNHLSLSLPRVRGRGAGAPWNTNNSTQDISITR